MDLKINPFDLIDKDVLKDIEFFFHQINDNALYKMGVKDSYEDHGMPALHESVEYFHPQITLDDRMRYIAENIVYADISQNNVICNTIISHFYGGRGIHQVATREMDPKKALVDFDRMLIDDDYKNKIITNLDDARNFGLSIYGSTELRTSLFGSANAYVAERDNKERDAHSGNIMQWVASFIENGLTEKMINSQSLTEIFKHITTLPGVGSYYGYHCGTSNSVNPNININHDEDFCVPGPGARKTLDMLFPNVSAKEFDYGDRVIWFRKNQVQLIGNFPLHESTHNIIVNGQKVFKDEQSDLKTYGCEVGLCQYGVYHRLKHDPKLANRRKVARIDDSSFERFINNEKIIPTTAKIIKPEKMTEEKIEIYKDPIQENINTNFNKLPDGYTDPFPGAKLKDPSSFIRKGELQKKIATKVLKAANEISKDNRQGVADHIIINKEKPTKVQTAGVHGTFEKDFKTDSIKNKVGKPKKKRTKGPKFTQDKIDLIDGIITEVGMEEFGHSDILSVVESKGGLGLKLDSNWKESWAIMQEMVILGMLEKNGRKYRRTIIKNI